jgi:hypothetical protein
MSRLDQRVAVTLLFTAAGLTLTSCGGGGSGNASGNAPSPMATATPTPTATSTPTSSYPSLSPSPTVSYSYLIGGQAGFTYNGDPATGQIVANSVVSGESPFIAFRYDDPTQTYSLVALDTVSKQDRYQLFSTKKGATDARYTDDRFVGYNGTVPLTGTPGILRLYKPASSNSELRLSYSSIGNLTRSGPVGHLNFGNFWFAYGVATDGADVPTSGAFNYSGVVYGFAVDPVGGKQFKIEGTTSLVLDYGTHKSSGSMQLMLIAIDGTRISLGSATFSDASFSAAPGTTSPVRLGPNVLGSQLTYSTTEAAVYGPNTQEIAGRISGTIAAGPTYGELTFVGAYAAAR